MNLRQLSSLTGALFLALLSMGTQRLEWNAHAIEEGPTLYLDSDADSQEFNVDVTLNMCAPGPEGEPVDLLVDISAGMEWLRGGEVDVNSTGNVGLSLYPSDGSSILTDFETIDSNTPLGGLYVSTPLVQCPAFGECERSYVAVFEAYDGIDATGWWTLTATAIGPRGSEDDYEGEVSISVSER